MIRTSLQRRSARGSAAETAARPPTRTKPSISVVTNKTFKTSVLVPAAMLLMQEWVQLPYPLQRALRAVVPRRTTFLSPPHNLGSRPPTKTNGRKGRGVSRDDHSRQGSEEFDRQLYRPAGS